MSYGKNAVAVDKLENLLDSRSFSPIAFASEIANRDEAFRIAFFEVAVNFIHETARLTPDDTRDSMMKYYAEMARRISRAVTQ